MQTESPLKACLYLLVKSSLMSEFVNILHLYKFTNEKFVRRYRHAVGESSVTNSHNCTEYLAVSSIILVHCTASV
jgi:hypothetical protein